MNCAILFFLDITVFKLLRMQTLTGSVFLYIAQKTGKFAQ